MSSQAKAKRILKAVREVLIQSGYAGTTISQVTAAAGVSRGLLHYYFKNKEEMLALVVRETVASSVELAHLVFSESQSADELAAKLAVALRQFLRNDPHFYNLFFESLAIARQSASIHQELQSLYARFRLAVREELDQAQARKIIAPHIPAKDLALLLTGLIDGLGLQLMHEPDLLDDAGLWKSIEEGIGQLLAP